MYEYGVFVYAHSELQLFCLTLTLLLVIPLEEWQQAYLQDRYYFNKRIRPYMNSTS